MDTINLAKLLPKVLQIGQASAALLREYNGKRDELAVKHKADDSPQTAADLASQELIVEALTKLTPSIPILAEESSVTSFKERSAWEYLWIIDPLDGTRGFVDGSDEFTVNIALIKNHTPVLGVLMVPMHDACYYAAKGEGAFKQVGAMPAVAIHAATLNWDNVRIMMGRYHGTNRMEGMLSKLLPNHELLECNSAYKHALLAEGVGDIYPRLGPTSEWDTAPGQCILDEAGGIMMALDGKVLQYNAKASMANPEFIALGDKTQAQKILTLFKQFRRAK